MRILLVHPPATFPSGGHRYNRALLDQARRQGLPLLGLSWQGPGLPDLGAADLVVWDSLFFDLLARVELPQPPRHLLLCHYLPSLDPTLSPEHRLTWQAIENAAARRMDGIIATGPSVGETLSLRHPGTAVWVCEPGVDERFLSPCKHPEFFASGPELITVANLLPAKGHWQLLEVLARLVRHPWRWHWVGACPDPVYALRLRNKIRQLGLSKRIVYQGALSPSRLRKLLDTADWFLFPSRFESFGMALVEAVARRLPIISSRVGVAERWVIPKRTGFLLEPGDWAGFARVLRRCFATPKPKSVWQLGYRSLPPPPTWEEVFRRWWEIVSASIRAR